MLGMTWVQLAVAVIIIGAIVAVVLVALRAYGMAPPGWLVNVLWIIAAAVVCVLAILLLADLWSAAGARR